MKLRLLRPVPNDFKISSPFGQRVLKGKIGHHNGIDFACPVGTPVKAAADGLIVKTGWENQNDPAAGYGIRVMQALVIDGVRYYCWYGHLNSSSVELDMRIAKGHVIGISGNTGRSTGPHLHFGVRKMDTNEFLDCEFYEEESNDDKRKSA